MGKTYDRIDPLPLPVLPSPLPVLPSPLPAQT